MSRPTEVLVKVEDLETLAGRYHGPDKVPFSVWATATERLIAAIPEPEWEPTEEQITAYCNAYGVQRVNREVARRNLQAARLVFGL